MQAVIFDMDDTLAATAALWRRAETRLLESLGATWTPELARTYKGMNALDVAATIHRALHPAVTVDECQRRMRGALMEEFARTPPGPMPGAVACVRRLARRANNKVAVASGSPLEAIERVMDNFGVRGSLAVLVSSESVKRGKPHPDVFLAAAELLGAPPADCLVIEDSLIGAQAANAAGMACCVVPSTSGVEFGDLAQLYRSLDEIA